MAHINGQVLRDALALRSRGGTFDDNAREMLIHYGIPPRDMHVGMPDLPEDMVRLGEEREPEWELARHLWHLVQAMRENPSTSAACALAAHRALVFVRNGARRDNLLAPRRDDLPSLIEALRSSSS